MNDRQDGILTALQDIKRILLGIALVLFSIAACAIGWTLRNKPFNAEGLSLIAGLLLLVCGAFQVWNGWTRRIPGNKNNKPEKQEEGPHAL